MRYLYEQEQKRRGDADFPIEFCHVTPQHSRYIMAMHWHMDCEWIFVRRGKFRLTANHNEYTLLAGDAAFISAGMVHGGAPENCDYECVVFDYEHMLHGSILENKRYQCLHALTLGFHAVFSAQDNIAIITEHMCSLLEQKKTGYEFCVYGILMELMGLLVQHISESTQPSLLSSSGARYSDALNLALRRVHLDYDQELTLKDLANEAGLAPQYFCRVFKEYTGRTPIDYINNYRIEYAAGLLCSTNLSILDISIASGFQDAGYFSRLFRKYKHTSARNYRKQHRNSDVGQLTAESPSHTLDT